MSTLHLNTEATLRQYVEHSRRRAIDRRDLAASLWNFLAGWADSAATDAEVGAVARVLMDAELGDPRG